MTPWFRTHDKTEHCSERKQGLPQQRFYLTAARRAAQTPLAEVLAIVGQQAVSVFA
jgi:hypothetical protein